MSEFQTLHVQMKIRKKIKKVITAFLSSFDLHISRKSNLGVFASPKYRAEIAFWKRTLREYQQWYKGDLSILYGEPSPVEAQKITRFSPDFNAIVTWEHTHQRRKYLEDLQLASDAFRGMTLLDVGCGPHPSAQAFSDCQIYCLDPLLPLYMEAGYPIHIYEDRVRFVCGFSERMPLPDRFFDAVISVNAIDHVDDFFATAREITRVLKPGGLLRFHIHYHQKTTAEPLELNDSIVQEAFKGVKGFRKLAESKNKRGSTVKKDIEMYTLWSNF
jgi:ubiquinone/menaquinone biosynthesis C-methylase UbiE